MWKLLPCQHDGRLQPEDTVPGLFENMERLTPEIVLMKARELYPDAHLRIITDDGSQFIPKDFRKLLSLLEMQQTFTEPAHSRSDDKLERFHRTFRSEHIGQGAYLNRKDAMERMCKWIRNYNAGGFTSRYFTCRRTMCSQTG
jgi:hypothetical protein